MSRVLAGKAALVTGAAQGVGAGVARALAAEGAQVLVTDLNAAGAAEVAAQINAERGAGVAFGLGHDVTSEAAWDAAVAAARAQMGGLSVLVNNAGVLPFGSVEDLSLEEWRRGMSVNADSVFLGCKHALPLMRESQPGSIVNIASVSALIASHNLAAYNASKAAVWMLTKSVALHCAKHGWDIRCNSVHPTFVRTAMLNDIVGDDPAALAKLARQVPLGRIGEVEDVAAAVVYLASDASRMMTGAELKLDGGLTAM
ncbi:SDR family oxidoreductase [Phenylobacterium sp. LjRoot219]|uniref:SDR family oxidoreductase n=1 Tax=Phenylobacterium sp. LjRoot219 TaxID=3342283 RepID=UPI003ED03085